MQTATTASPPTARLGAHERAAGAGGVLFALTVIAGAAAGGDIPPPDADAAEIVSFASEHAAQTHIAAALFVLGGIGIFPFLSMVWGRYRHGTGSIYARFGVLGFTGVAAFFGASLVARVALTAAAPRLSPTSDAAVALWSLENASMTVNSVFLAIALVGLTFAACSDGLAPRWMRYSAPIGAVALLIGPLAAVRSTDIGDTAAPGLIGLLAWLAFLLLAGTRILLGRAPIPSDQ